MEIIVVGQNVCGYIYIFIWEKKNQFQTKYKIVFAIKKNQDFLMRFFFFYLCLADRFRRYNALVTTQKKSLFVITR